MIKILIDHNKIYKTKLVEICPEKDFDIPIFVKRGDRLIGMVLYIDNEGWICSLGGRYGATGYHSSLIECLKSLSMYELFIEE